MSLPTYDLEIPQGATFTQDFLYLNPDKTPINLTGYSARMMIRECYESPTPILSLTEGSGIVTTPLLGKVTVTLTAAQTAAIAAGGYVYDIELENAPTVIRLIQGKVSINAEVTK